MPETSTTEATPGLKNLTSKRPQLKCKPISQTGEADVTFLTCSTQASDCQHQSEPWTTCSNPFFKKYKETEAQIVKQWALGRRPWWQQGWDPHPGLLSLFTARMGPWEHPPEGGWRPASCCPSLIHSLLQTRAPGTSPADSSQTLPSGRMNAHWNPAAKIFLGTTHSASSSLFNRLLKGRSFQKG